MTKIYKITNTATGKIYVGQTTKTLEERLNRHFYRATKENCQRKFYDEILNYGRNSFVIELIEECPDEYANTVESYWIYKLNTIENGYNSCLSQSKSNTSSKGVSNEEYMEKLQENKIYAPGASNTREPVKEVIQYTLDGEYIATHKSARAAEIALFGDEHKAGRVSFIQQAARGAKQQAYGFKWAYK